MQLIYKFYKNKSSPWTPLPLGDNSETATDLKIYKPQKIKNF